MGLFSSSPKRNYSDDYDDEDDWPAADLSPETARPAALPEAPAVKSGTVISKDMIVSGALKGNGAVRIEGSVDGEIDLDGSVIVAPTGAVTGPVKADVIRVAGKVEGNVTAKEHLRLEKTGRVHGDVETSSLVIEDGGRLNGRTTMTAKEPEPLPRPAAAPELQFGPSYPVGREDETGAEAES